MNAENKIFIGGLAPMTTQDSLFNYFSNFGEISECKLVMDKVTGQSKCYAFIFFKELADAQRAVEGGSAIIDGKRCNCNLASSHTPNTQQQQQPQGEIVTEIKKVFVGGIGPNTTRDTVHAAFSQFGDVLECKVIVDQNTGFSKGFGFVEFTSPISAQKATASGFIMIDGKNCNCNLAFSDNKGDSKSLNDQGECKVFVGGLAPTVTSESLSVAMAPYGKVESCKVVLDKATQVSKGFGFVEFASSKSAARAVKNGFVLVDGKNCNCNIASQGGNNNNNNNNNNNAMSMGMGFSQMAMPYAMPYAMPMTSPMGFQAEPLGVDGLAYLKEQLYTVIQGSTTTQVLFANTRMLLNSLEGMYGGDMQSTMAMQQPYGYANPTTNLSLLKRPFGQGTDANEIKNKKPKPNEAQGWTPYTGLTNNFQQNQFDMTGGYRR